MPFQNSRPRVAPPTSGPSGSLLFVVIPAPPGPLTRMHSLPPFPASESLLLRLRAEAAGMPAVSTTEGRWRWMGLSR